MNAIQKIEREIAHKIIVDAKALGYKMNINNGGNVLELEEATDDTHILLKTMFATDDEHLIFYKDGRYKGFIWLIYGNDGTDVVCDYSVNLEEIMTPVNKMIDEKYYT